MEKGDGTSKASRSEGPQGEYGVPVARFREVPCEYWASREFSADEEYRGFRFVLSERIPEDVEQLGDGAVMAYAEARIRWEFEEFCRRIDEKIAARDPGHPDNELVVVVGGVSVRGRVLLADGERLRVQIGEPYEGVQGVRFSFASPARMLVHDANGEVKSFTEYGLRVARGLLEGLYLENLRRERTGH
jgi:hypothetical protein